jgi:hypothetical protein
LILPGDFFGYLDEKGLLHSGLKPYQHLTQVRRLGGVFDFLQENTLDTNLSGTIWGILFA